jgi:hypothetical protein
MLRGGLRRARDDGLAPSLDDGIDQPRELQYCSGNTEPPCAMTSEVMWRRCATNDPRSFAARAAMGNQRPLVLAGGQRQRKADELGESCSRSAHRSGRGKGAEQDRWMPLEDSEGPTLAPGWRELVGEIQSRLCPWLAGRASASQVQASRKFSESRCSWPRPGRLTATIDDFDQGGSDDSFESVEALQSDGIAMP